MAGTTPVWKIPYPTGSDRVADGDNAMQSLAERADAIWNGTNDAVINGNGGSCVPTASSVPMRRGNIVTVPVEFTISGAGVVAGASPIAQIVGPSYRPTVTLNFLCVTFPGGAPVFLSFRTDGTIISNTSVAAGQTIYGTATYCATNG